jgi:transposase
MQGLHIVYLDESGFAVDSPRTHGYAEKGRRCYAKKDWHAKGRINAIGAIVGFAFLSVCLFNCNIDSDVFYAWLTKDLLPKVPPDSVIVMDNAAFHKRSDMREAIESAGHTPEFLPPYSPDLNPIEHKWAEAKAKRKKERCNVKKLFSNARYYDNL